VKLKVGLSSHKGMFVDRSWRGKTYRNCAAGCEIVDYMITTHWTMSRLIGTHYGQQLYALGMRPSEGGDIQFEDHFVFYTFDSVEEPQLKLDLQLPKEKLEKLKAELLSSDLISDRKFRLVQYQQCLVGVELVDWLLDKGYVTERLAASKICNQLFKVGLRFVDDTKIVFFHDEYLFYTFAPRSQPGDMFQSMNLKFTPVHTVRLHSY